MKLKQFSTCLLLMVTSDIFTPSSAKMDWIYKELKRERPDDDKINQAVTDFTQIPQYYRFNQHFSLSLNFDEHLSKDLFEKMQEMEEVKDSIYEDDYFSHIFKRIQSEYLVTSDDGEFIDMVCTSWLDIGQEMEQLKEETPAWKTDLSQIRTNERNHMQPLHPISDELAA